MIINGKEINIDDLNNIDYESKLLKKQKNGLMLSEEQINILNKYNINYLNCTNIKELIFVIEDILQNSYEELDDLDDLSNKLSEYNYYFYTNK